MPGGAHSAGADSFASTSMLVIVRAGASEESIVFSFWSPHHSAGEAGIVDQKVQSVRRQWCHFACEPHAKREPRQITIPSDCRATVRIATCRTFPLPSLDMGRRSS